MQTDSSALAIGEDGFTVPLDAALRRIALLGQPGAGKSNGTTDLAEELLRRNQVVVVIDYKGDFWGLRSKYPIAIFGGDHADLELRPDAGASIADSIVANRYPAVIDCSEIYDRDELVQLITAFASRMFFAKRSDPRPIHIIFDEVDQFCPEQPAKGEIEMARSVERLAKLGRKRGIGVSLTTQAPASVSKRLLEICDLIFFMQLSGRNTLKAVVETLQNKISDEQMLELKRGVAQLQLGEAYAWSPGWLRIASPHRFEATMCCGCGAVIVS